MYKIVVVEDEPLLLRNIKASIAQATDRFEVVGEASDGDEALEIIREVKPDVVFTDIRMPTMDGLALIEQLRLREYCCRIVILSGYQEFEYAKRALQLGVEEYLLKPISPLELKNLLARLADKLTELAHHQKIGTLSRLIHSDINSLPPPALTANLFHEYRSFGAILLCAGSLNKFSTNWLTPAKDYWLQTSLEDVLQTLLPLDVHPWVLTTANANERLLVLGSLSDAGAAAFPGLCAALYKRLQDEPVPVTLVFGDPMTRADDLPYKVQTYRIHLMKSLRFGCSTAIDIQKSEPMPSLEELPIDLNIEKLLTQWVEKKQQAPFRKEFAGLMNHCRSTKPPQIRLERILKRTLHLFQGRYPELTPTRMLELELEVDELLTNSYRYSSVTEGMLLIFNDLFRLLLRESEAAQEQELLAQAVAIEQYLCAHYYEPLTMQQVADFFGLSSAALSRAFKKLKGIPPNEFLIQLRINKAKELLRLVPPLTIKEIANAIGYEDSFYMSRIFKSKTGMNPTEYREAPGGPS